MPLESASARDNTVESHEPSMEEILASIRRIIADDQSLAAQRLHSAAEAIAPQEDDTPAVEAEPAAQPIERPVMRAAKPKFFEEAKPAEPVSQVESVAPAIHIKAAQPVAQQAPSDFSNLRLRPLIDETEEEKPLAHNPTPAPSYEPATSFRETAPVPPAKPIRPEAVASEGPLTSSVTESAVASSFAALFTSRLLPDEKAVTEMTRELLRPMLKAWLDDNLPVLVERLVRTEIERVARGGR